MIAKGIYMVVVYSTCSFSKRGVSELGELDCQWLSVLELLVFSIPTMCFRSGLQLT